jgi:hypothetical protein
MSFDHLAKFSQKENQLCESVNFFESLKSYLELLESYSSAVASKLSKIFNIMVSLPLSYRTHSIRLTCSFAPHFLSLLSSPFLFFVTRFFVGVAKVRVSHYCFQIFSQFFTISFSLFSLQYAV